MAEGRSRIVGWSTADGYFCAEHFPLTLEQVSCVYLEDADGLACVECGRSLTASAGSN